MILLEEKLIKALECTGLQVFNIERPETIKNCIVYTYLEKDEQYCDDESDIESFTIYVNLYVNTGLNKYKKIIKKSMKSEGFRLESIAILTKLRNWILSNKPSLFIMYK